MGNCSCCHDDAKEKNALKILFKGSIGRYLTTVVVLKPDKEAQVALAELVDACVTALGITRTEAKSFVYDVAFTTKEPKVTKLCDGFLLIADQIHADVRKSSLVRAWLTFDKDSSGDLSMDELQKLVASLNFDDKLSKRLIEKTREIASGASAAPAPAGDSSAVQQPLVNNSIQFPQFEKAFDSISAFDELAFAWDELHNGNGASQTEFTESQLGGFLRSSQGHSTDFQAHAKKLCAALNGRLTKDKFISLLSSPELNGPTDQVRVKNVYQNMTAPLSHYFISSSHNTYLTGDQLTSESHPDCYKRALLDGCRCVELDCWTGPESTQPVIYHGYTRTSKISFDSVIDTINKYAFETSEYPVILSLELHVDQPSQEHMAKKMKQTFGTQLALPNWPGGSGPSASENVVVSPESHKRKIIVKAKRVKGEMAAAEDDSDDDLAGKADEIKRNKAAGGQKKASGVCKALSDLVIMEGCHFKSYDDQNVFHFQCCSIVEAKAIGMSQSHQEEFAEYNNRRVTRVYPAGSRVDSGNYNPQVLWNAGCQLVAMNWQTSQGYELRFYKGRFMDNANCGYLLKPPCLLQAGQGGAELSKPEYWTVEILSGFCIPKPLNGDDEVIDPYVYAFCEGPHIREKEQVLKTQVIDDNGFHPVWRDSKGNSQTFKVPVPELSTLVIQLWDKDAAGIDDFLVEAFLPCHLIRPGIRCVPLRDIESRKLQDSCLMVRLSMAHAPPSKMAGIASPAASPAAAGLATPGKATPPPAATSSKTEDKEDLLGSLGDTQLEPPAALPNGEGGEMVINQAENDML